MRVRTDGDYAHREGMIERTADYPDCHGTRPIVAACEDVPAPVAAPREVLERDDLTRQ